MRYKLPPLPQEFDLEVLRDENHELRPLYLEFTYAYNKVCFAKFYLSFNQRFRIPSDIDDLCSDVYTDLVTNIYKYLYNQEKKRGNTTLHINFLKKHIYRRSWARLKELLNYTGVRKQKSKDKLAPYTLTSYSRTNSDYRSYNVIVNNGNTEGVEWVTLLKSDSPTPHDETQVNMDVELSNMLSNESMYSWENYKKKSKIKKTVGGEPVKITLAGTFVDGKNVLYFGSIKEASKVMGKAYSYMKQLARKKETKLAQQSNSFIQKIERL